MNTIEVHNVYTLQELSEDGTLSETPLLIFFRPQDWGNPQRWHYHQCSIAYTFRGTNYINNCHIYQEVERNSVEAFQAIAPYLFEVYMPGCPVEIAAKSHLQEDDFWSEAWGDLPPYYEPDDNEEDYSPDELA